MNILAGTFRVSLVAAALAAGYYSYENLQRHEAEQAEDRLFKMAMECGARIDAAFLEQKKNDYGNIDIGALGCASRKFITNAQELSEVRAGTYQFKSYSAFKPFDPLGTAVNAFAAFVLVNLAGLAFVGARSVLGWVLAGFKGKWTVLSRSTTRRARRESVRTAYLYRQC